jgi:hypothetical protein
MSPDIIFDLKCREGFWQLAGGFPLPFLMLWPLISDANDLCGGTFRS